MTMLKAYPLSEGWRPLPGVIWERRATIVPPHRTDDYLIDNAGAPRYFALVEYSEGPPRYNRVVRLLSPEEYLGYVGPLNNRSRYILAYNFPCLCRILKTDDFNTYEVLMCYRPPISAPAKPLCCFGSIVGELRA